MIKQGSVTEPLRLERSAYAMGATFSVVLYGHDPLVMEEAVAMAFDELRRLDELLSDRRPASEWSLVNRHAAQRPVKVSQELFWLLSECLEYSRQSEGAFDISVGPLIKAWGFFNDAGRLPGEEELAAARNRVGYRHILLDPAAQTVMFDLPGMEISPGGIGKGYAVDRMVELLKQRDLDTALVAGSGSSICGLGVPPGESRGWRVEIRNPAKPRQAAAEVFLNNLSISTSGSYEKCFWAKDRLYSHILDPRTGYPTQGVASVSVIAPRALDSEAWAKACFLNGRHWAASHKPSAFRVL